MKRLATQNKRQGQLEKEKGDCRPQEGPYLATEHDRLRDLLMEREKRAIDRHN